MNSFRAIKRMQKAPSKKLQDSLQGHSVAKVDLYLVAKLQFIMKNYINPELFEESTQVDDLVSRFCSYINIERKQSCKIAKKVREMNIIIDEKQILIGKTPSAVSASCIYYVLSNENMNIQKKYLSQQLNVSVVTINKITQILRDNSHLFNHISSPQ